MRGTGQPNKTCVACGAAFYAPPSQREQRHFCSNACRKAHPELDGNRGPKPRRKRPEQAEEQFRVHSRAEAIALIETRLRQASENAALDRMTLDLLYRWPSISARRDRAS